MTALMKTRSVLAAKTAFKGGFQRLTLTRSVQREQQSASTAKMSSFLFKNRNMKKYIADASLSSAKTTVDMTEYPEKRQSDSAVATQTKTWRTLPESVGLMQTFDTVSSQLLAIAYYDGYVGPRNLMKCETKSKNRKSTQTETIVGKLKTIERVLAANKQPTHHMARIHAFGEKLF